MSERPELRRRAEPQRVISDSSYFEILSPENKRRIVLNIGPDDSITFRVERLTTKEEQHVSAEAHFTEVTRHLIHSLLEQEAARISPESEQAGPDLSVLTYQEQFGDAVGALIGLKYSDKQVQRLILTQGQQIVRGQEHIGEIPTIVREQIDSLNQTVSEIYLERARRSEGVRRQR